MTARLIRPKDHAAFKYQYFPLFNPIRNFFQVDDNQQVNILKYKQKIDHSFKYSLSNLKSQDF